MCVCVCAWGGSICFCDRASWHHATHNQEEPRIRTRRQMRRVVVVVRAASTADTGGGFNPAGIRELDTVANMFCCPACHFSDLRALYCAVLCCAVRLNYCERFEVLASHRGVSAVGA